MAEHLDAICQQRMQWFNSLSDDDKAKVRAAKEADRTDEGEKAARMAEAQANFGMSDANNDGKLDKEEFRTFMRNMSEAASNRGLPAMSEDNVDEEMKDKVWAFFNSQSAGDGLELADIMAGVMAIGQRTRELAGQ